jgi:hypothetical protein
MKFCYSGLTTAVLFVWLVSCGPSPEEVCEFTPDLSAVQADFSFEALEDSLPAISSKKDLTEFLQQNTAVRDLFFARGAYPDDSTFINTLYKRLSHPSFDTLRMETKNAFKDYDLRQQFREAFASIKYYYPEFVIPKVQTMISGLETDLVVTDSLIIVGLDYFQGPQARYKPNLYEYMQKRYYPQFIVPSVLLLYGIDGRINETDLTDKTMLAEMVTYGKAYYFARRMLPCVADSVFIGYSAQEMADARYNRSTIWKKLIENEALFSVDQRTKQRYISERPKTFEVGDQCPGRIGTWVGWEIVKEFAKRHPEITLPQLMEMKNADQIFRDSKYKP